MTLKITPHDLSLWLIDIIIIILHYLCQHCKALQFCIIPGLVLCHHVWTVPLIVLACAFVPLCEIISGVLFAVDHLTASFTINSFLYNPLVDPITYD